MSFYTASISYPGIDISRKSGMIEFAPSWRILKPALKLRSLGLETEESWQQYVIDYTDEMRESFRVNRSVWNWLVSQDEFTLCCYCNLKRHPGHCHRLILAGILTKLGLRYGGER